jgi:hypothetical protein
LQGLWFFFAVVWRYVVLQLLFDHGKPSSVPCGIWVQGKAKGENQENSHQGKRCNNRLKTWNHRERRRKQEGAINAETMGE